MDGRLHFPGLSNSWTMPVENRLDMELTGIKTPVGLKIQGPDVDRIQQIGSQIEEILGPFRAREEYSPNESHKGSTSTSMSTALSPRGTG